MPRPPDISEDALKGLHKLRADVRADIDADPTLEDTLNALLEAGVEGGVVQQDAMARIRDELSEKTRDLPGSTDA